MYTLPTAPGTLLHCGQCDDYSAPLTVRGAFAICPHCSDVKYIAHDIAPHIESSESLVVTPAGFLAYVTEED